MLVLFLTSITVTAQNTSCRTIKNGTFKYLDSRSNEIIVKRRDSIQIDSSKSENFWFKSKVNWTSECDYQLTIVEVNDSSFDLILGKTFEFEIIDIKGNQVRLKTRTLNKLKESIRSMQIIETN